MTSGTNKSCDSLKLVSNIKDKIDLKRSDKYTLVSTKPKKF